MKTGRYQSGRAHGPHQEFGVYPKYSKRNWRVLSEGGIFSILLKVTLAAK